MFLRSAFLSVYVAAALSFGAGLWRDWELVRQVPDYQQVFGAMYWVWAASGFAVNAVTLGYGFERDRGRQWSLTFGTLLVFVVFVQVWHPMPARIFWWMLPVPVLYVIGAQYSRRLLDSGHVLLARMRDGLSSLTMVALVAMGFGVESFPLSVAVGTLLIGIALHSRPGVPASSKPGRQTLGFGKAVGVIFYSNIASVLFYVWALSANSAQGTLFGFEAPIVVRVAMYLFQLFSLPSVLLSRWRPAANLKDFSWVTWGCIAGAAIAAALPLQLSILVFPLAALAALYSSVLLMHVRHHQATPS